MAFTEQGVSMLSGVLKSQIAIKVHIHIIRVFSRIKEMLLTHKEILLKLERLEKEMRKQKGKMNKYEKDLQVIFGALKELLNPLPRPRIGFKRSNEE